MLTITNLERYKLTRSEGWWASGAETAAREHPILKHCSGELHLICINSLLGYVPTTELAVEWKLESFVSHPEGKDSRGERRQTR